MLEVNNIYEGDCLELMKSIPDKSIDLVLTDPPYGLGDRLSNGSGKLKNTPMKVLYENSGWEDIKPAQEVFNEIFRISKNQIIWGGNYFSLPPTRCFIMWDKKQPMPTFSACEYAWTSFDKPAKMFSCSSTDLNRVHPTQKPLKLFEWLLMNYSQEGQTILDPFSGSGTTAIACIKTNRNYICIEKEPKYVEISRKRVESELDKYKLAI